MTAQLNIDPNEIAKFESLAADWWNLQGNFKPLHEINPLRLNYIQQHTQLAQKKVIDIGCGGGILAESMAKLGAIVTGIDLSETAIQVAQQHAQSQKLTINYQKMPIEMVAEQYPEKFDVVTCMELLEHVPNPAATIKDCAKLVKPGGQVFFSTLNRNPKAYLFAVIGAEYLLKLLPKGTHDYAKFIRPAELEAWARAAELSVKEFMGMSYQPLTRQYRLTNNIDVNYLVFCQRVI